MEVWFPAYRRHDLARIRANDAVMALVVASRLASDQLEGAAGTQPGVLLPAAFPELVDLQRLNRTVEDARVLVRGAERQFVFMAIPYLLSVHHVFVAECIDLVENAGAPRVHQGEPPVRLELVHERFTEVVDANLSENLLAMFHLLRHLRNRIVHFAACQGSHLREKWVGLGEGARVGWEHVAGRPLPMQRSDEELDLALGELVAALMVVTRLGREVSAAMSHALPPSRWARLVVDDYRREHPARFGQRARRAARCLGYARERYGPVGLTEADIDAALAELDNELRSMPTEV